ncbi:winged helix-turn-helix domain-containing protein [Streptomyces sp. NPDC051740]|uniref:winged helix-turn-helix domain-containing protein n=1 Tax=Streptomyces sp. NPDC051740 TaxID=3365673 RepID=UPI0037907965
MKLLIGRLFHVGYTVQGVWRLLKRHHGWSCQVPVRRALERDEAAIGSIHMVHLQLGTPVVWIRDNLSVHLQQELFDSEAEHRDWLVIFHLPPYAPEITPREGIWSLLKRSRAGFAAADLTHLTRVIKRKPKKIQYRPHLITGCLPTTGLDLDGLINKPDITNSIRVRTLGSARPNSPSGSAEDRRSGPAGRHCRYSPVPRSRAGGA